MLGNVLTTPVSLHISPSITGVINENVFIQWMVYLLIIKKEYIIGADLD